MANAISFTDFNQSLCDEVERLQQENSQLRKRADANFCSYLGEMLAHNRTKEQLEALTVEPDWEKLTEALNFDPPAPTYNQLETVPSPDWAPGVGKLYELFMASERKREMLETVSAPDYEVDIWNGDKT